LFRLEKHEWAQLLAKEDVELASGYATVHGKKKYFVDSLELMAADVTQVFGRMSKDPQWQGLERVAMSLVGGNLAESHCERVISAANLIMSDGRTLLGDNILEMLCVLRMNRAYMEDAKTRYVSISSMGRWVDGSTGDTAHLSWLRSVAQR